MKLLGLLVVSGLGVTTISAALSWYANTQNQESEQARFAIWSANDVQGSSDAVRGELVARAGGCIACHTDSENDGEPLAGGVKLVSSFGTFVSPNISSDPVEGIGAWSVDMFAEALLNGRRPDGKHYWPAFPYPAYAAMHGQDVVDLYAWLQTTYPVATAAPKHELMIPEFTRVGLGVWKALYVPDDHSPDAFSERGEYLVKGPAHCAECHAQRDLAGGLSDRRLSGNTRGPDGYSVPDITADALKDWTTEDLSFFLEIGMTPDGDFSGGHMAKVIEHGTAHLPIEDLEAMASYLKSSANAKSP